jgi:hypothetical protein
LLRNAQRKFGKFWRRDIRISRKKAIAAKVIVWNPRINRFAPLSDRFRFWSHDTCLTHPTPTAPNAHPKVGWNDMPENIKELLAQKKAAVQEASRYLATMPLFQNI